MNLGRYELMGKLASGGMAEVYLAKAAGPMGFEKRLVIKRILPHLAEDASFIGTVVTCGNAVIPQRSGLPTSPGTWINSP